MAVDPALQAHLDSGTTTLCRCWKLVRRDGQVLGFTDHDCSLVFDGVTFRAETGLSAEALAQSTGLSVDNTEAVGAFSDISISEADLVAGRFDGAAVEAWLVNWADPSVRSLRFRGSLGEIQSGGGAFRAELRGLSERLNRPQGRVYQAHCGAELGDAACGLDVTGAAYRTEVTVVGLSGRSVLTVPALSGYADGWFARGVCTVLTGGGAGHVARIKRDAPDPDGGRMITLWEDLRAPLAAGDTVRLQIGCDKRLETCRSRFANVQNFRGFPHVPGDDWMIASPVSGGRHNGGSRN